MSYLLSQYILLGEAEWIPNTMTLMKYILHGNYEFVDMLRDDPPCFKDIGGLYMIVAAPNANWDAFETKLLDFLRWQEKAPKNDRTYQISKVLPVYIGQTSNLRNRYHQHCKNSMDQCRNLTIEGTSLKNPKFYFLYREMKPVTAMIMESIFLHTYDFALNVKEQTNRKRDRLVSSNREEDFFCKAYMNEEHREKALELHGTSKTLLKHTIENMDEGKREITCAERICKRGSDWSVR